MLMVLMAVLMALMATIVRYMPWIENDRDINQYKYRITHTEIVIIHCIYIYMCVRVNLLCWPGCGVLPCSCRTAFAGCAETSVSEQFAAHGSLSQLALGEVPTFDIKLQMGWVAFDQRMQIMDPVKIR